MKWISVKDRLPQTGNEYVLVLNSYKEMAVARYEPVDETPTGFINRIGAWRYPACMCCEEDVWNITHWAEITPPDDCQKHSEEKL